MMMRSAFSALVLTLLATSSLHAAPLCREGRAPSGECVNTELASVMRHTAIVKAQAKISYDAPLNLPSEDSFYPPARDHHEERAIFGLPQRTPGRAP